MPRRIFRDEKYENIYQKLCEGEDAIFNQLKDVFLMAACIGYKVGIRTKLTKRGKDFPWSVFNGDTDESIINAIALAESNDVKILIDEQEQGHDDRVTIIEEYANTGIEYLKVEVLDRGGHPVENLLTYINSQQNKGEDDIYNLDNFMI
ncbi:DNA phosphorothioation-associated protein 4 [Clostridium sp. A1-XYC3]|uniref:DNA phosphorothioation-associated protein 4 n=1 Tax=Clostridium tanneri TaxID=3037988 RepID=A0ABU4JWD2_9CLOT|nr:DNA phosphorothioation-associated protein 4 [Clostridium sp. A1-XYC3]MDW8802466.1 DNA phosphorothioation-associated protein 4 [Clostridium sp. A1-XYC3]